MAYRWVKATVLAAAVTMLASSCNGHPEVRLRSIQPRDGWIVDLRDDYGGDVYPMLAAVEPPLGCSHPLGYRDAVHGTTWYLVRGGTVGVQGGSLGASEIVAEYGTPPPPVPCGLALLAGVDSSGHVYGSSVAPDVLVDSDS